MKDPNYNQYHPVRWRNDKPCAKSLFNAARRTKITNHPTLEAMNEFMSVFQSEWNTAIMRFAYEERPAGTEDFSNEFARAMHATAFWDQFRNIYSLDQELFEMLAKTDAGSIPFNYINWPHKFCFVAFPAGNGIRLNSETNEIDGVYIDTRHGGLALLVIARTLKNQCKPSTWPKIRDEHYYFQSEPHENETIAEILSESFRSDLTRFETDPSLTGDDISELETTLGVKIQHTQAQNDKLRAAHLVENFDAAYLACSIAINVACYLSGEPPIETRWPDHTPTDLKTAITTGTARQGVLVTYLQKVPLSNRLF